MTRRLALGCALVAFGVLTTPVHASLAGTTRVDGIPVDATRSAP